MHSAEQQTEPIGCMFVVFNYKTKEYHVHFEVMSQELCAYYQTLVGQKISHGQDDDQLELVGIVKVDNELAVYLSDMDSAWLAKLSSNSLKLFMLGVEQWGSRVIPAALKFLANLPLPNQKLELLQYYFIIYDLGRYTTDQRPAQSKQQKALRACNKMFGVLAKKARDQFEHLITMPFRPTKLRFK